MKATVFLLLCGLAYGKEKNTFIQKNFFFSIVTSGNFTL